MENIVKALLDGKAIVVEMEHQGRRVEFRGYMKNDYLHGCYRFNLPEPMPILNRGVKAEGLVGYFEEMFYLYDNARLTELFDLTI